MTKKRFSFFLLLYIVLFTAKSQTFNVGDTLPDFSFFNTIAKDKLVSLSQLRGSYVLIFFWASWNPESRKINRELLPIYSRFKDKNFSNAKRFNIVSVSVDTNPKPYELALKKDNPAWFYHFCNFNGWMSLPLKTCGVKQIPTLFLLDPNGIILKKNISTKELETILRSL